MLLLAVIINIVTIIPLVIVLGFICQPYWAKFRREDHPAIKTYFMIVVCLTPLAAQIFYYVVMLSTATVVYAQLGIMIVIPGTFIAFYQGWRISLSGQDSAT